MLGIREGIGQRSETVRRSNLSAIVRALHDDGPLSRSELVALTGLTRSAIRGLVGEPFVFDPGDRSGPVRVLGGAGTGKSLALAEGAKQEADQGQSVLITFRSPGLAPSICVG